MTRVARLVGVELNRLTSRRLTWVVLLVVAALLGLLQLQVNQSLIDAGPAELAAQRQAYERDLQDWEANHAQREAQCQADGDTAEDCVEDRPTEEDYNLVPPDLSEIALSMIQASAYLGGIAIFLITASFIGAEFTSGSIGNWLSFVPRRGEVYAAKLIAVVIGAVGIGLALSLLTLGCIVALAALHGVPVVGLAELFAAIGRASGSGVVFAVLGFVLALLGRHTVAALGVLLGYAVVAFVRATVSLSSDAAAELWPWTPELNLTALVDNGTSYYRSDGRTVETVTAMSGSVYLIVLTALFAVVGWLVFRRRDVS